MMARVGLSLLLHEMIERIRDRWVLLSSAMFALLASAVSLYGRSAGASAGALTGPSLVTLVSLVVPLVAMVLSHDAIVGERDRNTLGLLLSLPVTRLEVVFAKFLGRGLALAVAITAGLSIAAAVAGGEQGRLLLSLLWPTLLLGFSFLSIGMLISSTVTRPVTAASLVVTVWFLLVFFYDLALLGLLVVSDGSVSQETVAALVFGNPSGLYRMQMMNQLAGPEVLANLGMTVSLPSAMKTSAIWVAWIVGPLLASGALLAKRKVR